MLLGGATALIPLSRPAARILMDTALKPLRAARRNRFGAIAVVAIVLSVVNLGILIWQIWPEGSYTPPDRPRTGAPSGDFRDVTEQRMRQLERELGNVQNELSGVRGFGIGGGRISDLEGEISELRSCVDRLRSGRDYLPFGC